MAIEYKLMTDKFKFYVDGKVKFAEVDSFDVVHNIQYLYWLESARVDYFERIGIEMKPDTIAVTFPVMVVSSTINYHKPLLFTEKYRVYCRISILKNSSMIFENIVVGNNGDLIASAQSVLVHLDRETNMSKRIPDEIRAMIISFEGNDLELIENKS